MMSSELNKEGNQRISEYVTSVARRNDLIEAIKKEFGDDADGIVVLFAGFERDCQVFYQESTFYYFTGIKEPGVVLVLDLQDRSTLYKPDCSEDRSKWMSSAVELTQENAELLKLDKITVLGDRCAGYTIHPLFSKKEYSNLLERLQKVVSSGKSIFIVNPENSHEYIESRLVLERLNSFIPGLNSAVKDISPIVARMRRKKNQYEIEQLYKAVEATIMAHGAAVSEIRDGEAECKVRAGLEHAMHRLGMSPAFPSIVASGKNATILHYTANNGVMHEGDLIIVDIGAKYNGYCADLTRTYPISGTFTKKQREWYKLVLETQEYIASIAKPGYWLKNEQKQDKSLHHLAKKFLAKHGYDKYFTHGIGHFLGLDVHDVGDYSVPLQEGDIITIEPGLYMPEEGTGIRIEDNYWVVEDGVICLSDSLPKQPNDIEEIMQQSLELDNLSQAFSDMLESQSLAEEDDEVLER